MAQRDKKNFDAYNVAAYWQLRGDTDRAADWYATAFAERSPSMPGLWVDVRGRPEAMHPRIRALLAELGLPPGGGDEGRRCHGHALGVAPRAGRRARGGRGPVRAARALDESALRLDPPGGRVSHEHARLERMLGEWVIADLGSKNGVYDDGERVERGTLRARPDRDRSRTEPRASIPRAMAIVAAAIPGNVGP